MGARGAQVGGGCQGHTSVSSSTSGSEMDSKRVASRVAGNGRGRKSVLRDGACVAKMACAGGRSQLLPRLVLGDVGDERKNTGGKDGRQRRNFKRHQQMASRDVRSLAHEA